MAGEERFFPARTGKHHVGGKVLIIDDDAALLRLMSMAFQRAGFT